VSRIEVSSVALTLTWEYPRLDVPKEIAIDPTFNNWDEEALDFGLTVYSMVADPNATRRLYFNPAAPDEDDG
jgi:hypothetical protein